MLFKLDFFFMALSIVVLDTQIQKLKMRFSKLIIKRIAQKVMIKYDLDVDYYDLKYVEVGFFSFIFLEFITIYCTHKQYYNLIYCR